MLITKPYDSVTERMVGDIDIFVDTNHINEAQNLLKNSGFFEIKHKKFSFVDGVIQNKDERHLNRLVHKEFIASVELHKYMLKKKFSNLLKPDEIFNTKHKINGCWVPSNLNLWKHAILNWQYNDLGLRSNRLSFRSVIDVLSLEEKIYIDNFTKSDYAISHFYNLLSVYFEEYNTKYPLSKKFYIITLKFNFLYSIYSFFYKHK